MAEPAGQRRRRSRRRGNGRGRAVGGGVPHGHLRHRTRLPHPDHASSRPRCAPTSPSPSWPPCSIDVAVQVNVWRVLGRGAAGAARSWPRRCGRAWGRWWRSWSPRAGSSSTSATSPAARLGLAIFGVARLAGRGPLRRSWPAAAGAPGRRAGHGRVRPGRSGLLMIAADRGDHVSSRAPTTAAAARAAFWPGRVDSAARRHPGGRHRGRLHHLLGRPPAPRRRVSAGASTCRGLTRARRSLGILVTGVMRVLLFLAVLGVVRARGRSIPQTPRPAPSAWGRASGATGFFGVILWSAAITSVVGCTYTSLSFLRGLKRAGLPPGPRPAPLPARLPRGRFCSWAAPCACSSWRARSTGSILPVTLAVVLLAARRRDAHGRLPASRLAAGRGLGRLRGGGGGGRALAARPRAALGEAVRPPARGAVGRADAERFIAK